MVVGAIAVVMYAAVVLVVDMVVQACTTQMVLVAVTVSTLKKTFQYERIEKYRNLLLHMGSRKKSSSTLPRA